MAGWSCKDRNEIEWDGDIKAKKFIGTFSFPVYSTGWINRSDWTNVKLGSDPTKNIDSDVTHNFNCSIDKLFIQVLISQTASDTNSFQMSYFTQTAANPLGFQFAQVNLNSIRIQTGLQGVLAFSAAGAGVQIDTEDWYYKVTIYKIG
jgi:hypothetical protein